MSVILRVTAGPHAGAEVEVQKGRFVSVGCGPSATFRLPNDETLAETHLSVEYLTSKCKLRDMETEAGTLLNGTRVSAPMELENGDEISAGKSTLVFLASAEIKPHSMPVSGTVAAHPPSSLEPPSSASPEDSQMVVTSEVCNSGLTRFRGYGNGPMATRVASEVGEKFPHCLLVDPGRLGSAMPTDIPAPDYLLDWLGPEVAPLASPLVMCAGEIPDFDALLAGAWGKDAIVVLFTETGKEGVLQELRAASRVESSTPDGTAGEAVLGFYAPSLMSVVLRENPRAFVERLFPPVKAIMVESTDPEAWDLYAPDVFREELTKLGFVDLEAT